MKKRLLFSPEDFRQQIPSQIERELVAQRAQILFDEWMKSETRPQPDLELLAMGTASEVTEEMYQESLGEAG